MPNPWFRLYSEFEDDPKIQMMSEADQRRLVMLFCQRCKEQKRTDSQQSFKWRVSLDEVARTKAVFLESGFIDEDWNLVNWNKRQFLSDSSTERVRRHRRGWKQNETLLKQDETLDETKRNGTEERRTEAEENRNRLRGEETFGAAKSKNRKLDGDLSSLGSIFKTLPIPSGPLPQDKSAAIAAGYEFINSRACGVCGLDTEWWRSPAGKQVPFLADGGELHLGGCALVAKGAK